MTNNEAIVYLQADKEYLTDMKICDGEEMDVAIRALDKRISKKPRCIEDKMWCCPVCENNLLQKWVEYPIKLMPKSEGFPYCMSCGQAIDWNN